MSVDGAAGGGQFAAAFRAEVAVWRHLAVWLLIGLVAIGGGVAFFTMAAHDYRVQLTLDAHGVRTRGVLVHVDPKPPLGSRRTSDTVTVSYPAAHGTLTTRVDVGDQAYKHYHVGEHVQVVYDPRDPSVAALDGVPYTGPRASFVMALTLIAVPPILVTALAACVIWARALMVLRHAPLQPCRVDLQRSLSENRVRVRYGGVGYRSALWTPRTFLHRIPPDLAPGVRIPAHYPQRQPDGQLVCGPVGDRLLLALDDGRIVARFYRRAG